jgi:hypothetical protein
MHEMLGARPAVATLQHDYLSERDHKPTLLLWHAVISVLKWDILRCTGHQPLLFDGSREGLIRFDSSSSLGRTL